MAKRKTASKKTAQTARSAKTATKAKASGKTASPKSMHKTAAAQGKPAAKKIVTKSQPAKSTPRLAAESPFVSLGRPKVTADEPLYLLFKEDYHARQIFAFLRVETVRELEQFAAAEIIERLTRPVHESVERIRARLADKNRFLCGDEKYLIRHRKQVQADAEKE